ncbi:unnamed protein product [Mytilus coruscus]|uniref:Uncharacterized protein n=1 Tax=Mytilus coruscus TaxID=42192 RepID=A0A6J8EP46_MYTCO|nr:unnamed protein product [Mytilus coruscus]
MTTAPYLDSTQHHTIGSNKGIKDTEVIIYLSGGAGICLILICSIVCFCVGKKYQRTNINQNIGNNQQINLNNRANVDDAVLISQNVSIKRRSNIEYAEINELEMSDFISSPPEQGNTTAGDNSNNSSEGIRLPNDGNLNPYQSLLPTLQQPTHIQEDDSDDFEESRAYTNVYQSLQRKRQEKSRLYARCASLLCVEVVDEPI